jgi:hypothetical protein
VEQVQPAAQLLEFPRDPGRPVDLRDVARRFVDERPEVLAQQLVGSPAREPLTRVRDERESRLGVDRPDEVRRVLDEMAVPRLGIAEEFVELRVRQGNRGLVGKSPDQRGIVLAERARRPAVDLEGAERPGLTSDR